MSESSHSIDAGADAASNGTVRLQSPSKRTCNSKRESKALEVEVEPVNHDNDGAVIDD